MSESEQVTNSVTYHVQSHANLFSQTQYLAVHLSFEIGRGREVIPHSNNKRHSHYPTPKLSHASASIHRIHPSTPCQAPPFTCRLLEAFQLQSPPPPCTYRFAHPFQATVRRGCRRVLDFTGVAERHFSCLATPSFTTRLPPLTTVPICICPAPLKTATGFGMFGL